MEPELVDLKLNIEGKQVIIPSLTKQDLDYLKKLGLDKIELNILDSKPNDISSLEQNKLYVYPGE